MLLEPEGIGILTKRGRETEREREIIPKETLTLPTLLAACSLLNCFKGL